VRPALRPIEDENLTGLFLRRLLDNPASKYGIIKKTPQGKDK
jgi:hypothetical protein